jgi:hypothetical protein
MAKRSANSKGYSDRKVNNREVKQTFLIVCEGEETEPNYFRGFKCRTLHLKIEGKGKDPINLVKRAKILSSEDEFDQVWCVFDKDEISNKDFKSALQIADKTNIKIAYSNEAFELWYILHFQFLNTAISRSDYPKKLSSLMGKPYAKNSREMYDELFDLQPTAIAHADRLLREYPKPNPATDNPSTTVHHLVKELNRFI